MSPATVAALLQVALAFLPQIPAIITGFETAIGLANSGAAPTAEQQAQIDAALEAAHNALQAS